MTESLPDPIAVRKAEGEIAAFRNFQACTENSLK